MDWSKRSAHQWLEQYGSWVRTTYFRVSANPLVALIDRNDLARAKRISSKVSVPLVIEDYEAVEVSKLLAKMHSNERKHLAYRAWLLIIHYENDWSGGCV